MFVSKRVWLFTFCLTLILSSTVMSQGPGEPTTLTLWHAWDGARHELLKEIIERFEEANPGLRVEDRLMSPAVLAEQFIVAYSAGIAPDVIMVNPGMAMQFGIDGALLPLDELALRNDGVTMDQLFFPVIADAIQWEGKTYALPFIMSTTPLLYINRDLFEAAGLDSSGDMTHHEELLEAAQRTTVRDADGALSQLGLNISGDYHSYHLDNLWVFLEQFDVPLYDDAGKTIFPDFPGVVNVVDWMVDFETQVAGSSAAAVRFVRGHGGGQAAFLNWKTAMYIIPEWYYFRLKTQDPDFPLKVSLVPRPMGSEIRTSLTPGWSYGVASTTRHPDAAWRLVHWLTAEPEGGGYMAMRQSRLSPIPSMLTHPDYLADSPDMWPSIVESVSKATLIRKAMPMLSSATFQPLGTIITRILNHQETPLSGMEKARISIQSRIDDWWRANN